MDVAGAFLADEVADGVGWRLVLPHFQARGLGGEEAALVDLELADRRPVTGRRERLDFGDGLPGGVEFSAEALREREVVGSTHAGRPWDAPIAVGVQARDGPLGHVFAFTMPIRATAK